MPEGGALSFIPATLSLTIFEELNSAEEILSLLKEKQACRSRPVRDYGLIADPNGSEKLPVMVRVAAPPAGYS